MQEEITKTFQYIIANVTSAKILNALLTVGSRYVDKFGEIIIESIASNILFLLLAVVETRAYETGTLSLYRY